MARLTTDELHTAIESLNASHPVTPTHQENLNRAEAIKALEVDWAEWLAYTYAYELNPETQETVYSFARNYPDAGMYTTVEFWYREFAAMCTAAVMDERKDW